MTNFNNMIGLTVYSVDGDMEALMTDLTPLLDMGWEVNGYCEAPNGPHPYPSITVWGHDRHLAEMFVKSWDGDYLLRRRCRSIFEEFYGPEAVGTVQLVESYFEQADLETEFGLAAVTVKEMNGHLRVSETSLSITALGGYQPRNPRKESKILETFVAVVAIAALVFLYTLTS
jgi:hypothetical protein